MKNNADCARTTISESTNPEIKRDLIYKLRVTLAFIGIATLVIATYASLSFCKHCRELQCVGIIWIGAGNIASVLGLIPALSFWPWFSQRRVFKKIIIQKVSYSFAAAAMIFEWYIIIVTYKYWL